MSLLLADVLVPEKWVPYIIEQTAVRSRFWQSGIIGTDPTFQEGIMGGGKLIEMPFWQDLDGDDEVIDTDTEITLAAIGVDQDRARRQQRGKGWAAEDLAKHLSGSDPMATIGGLIAAYFARRMEVLLLASLQGIFGAASMASNRLSIHQTSGSITDANRITASTFIDATQKMGDQKERLTAICMHSAVEADLAKQDLIDYVVGSDASVRIPTFMGHSVIVDDQMTTTTVDSKTVYHSYLFGTGAIGYAERTHGDPVLGGIGTWNLELAREAGKAKSKLYVRRDFLLHPRGVQWSDGSLGGTFPTNAELATQSHWARVYEPKNVRIVQIQSNIAA